MTWVSTGAVAIILGIGGTVFIWQSIISDRNEHPATAGMTISEGAVTESSPDIIETPVQEPGNLVRETAATPVHNEHQTPPGMTTSEGAIPESSPHIVEMPSAEPSDLVKETAVPSNNNEQNIEKLLSQAATAVKEYRLTKPKNNNAYDYYQQVLELQPQHEKALDGIASIADAYADLAERKFDRYEYKATKKYVQRGLTIQPDNTRLLGLQKKANIGRILAQAVTALKEYRLTKPKNNNAYDYYQQVLELQPRHEKALDGITSIADAYADLAESKLDKFEYKAAKEYVHLGLTIQPENTRLQALQKNTSAFRDAPKRMWKKILSPFSKAL
jgi:serine/threonine-protein kinase PpkA